MFVLSDSLILRAQDPLHRHLPHGRPHIAAPSQHGFKPKPILPARVCVFLCAHRVCSLATCSYLPANLTAPRAACQPLAFPCIAHTFQPQSEVLGPHTLLPACARSALIAQQARKTPAFSVACLYRLLCQCLSHPLLLGQLRVGGCTPLSLGKGCWSFCSPHTTLLALNANTHA
jgi:hypothetical protein